MRKREGIEPRNRVKHVGADVVDKTEGNIKGAYGHGFSEPTGVRDRGTSPRQSWELGRSYGFFHNGSRVAQPVNREEARRPIGSRMSP